MQDNYIIQLEMNTFDDTPPSKVVHPRLVLGTTPRAKTRWEDQKKCILYAFKDGDFLIEIVPN